MYEDCKGEGSLGCWRSVLVSKADLLWKEVSLPTVPTGWDPGAGSMLACSQGSAELPFKSLLSEKKAFQHTLRCLWLKTICFLKQGLHLADIMCLNISKAVNLTKSRLFLTQLFNLLLLWFHLACYPLHRVLLGLLVKCGLNVSGRDYFFFSKFLGARKGKIQDVSNQTRRVQPVFLRFIPKLCHIQTLLPSLLRMTITTRTKSFEILRWKVYVAGKYCNNDILI